MRIVYPSLTAGDYLNIIKAKAVKAQRKKPLLQKKGSDNTLVLAGIVSVLICAAGVLSLVLKLSRLLAALASISAFISFAAVTVALMKRDRDKKVLEGTAVNEEPEPWEVDSELLSFYMLCDSIRYTGIYNSAMHIEGDECRLDFSYDCEGERKKASVRMSWRLSGYVDDLLIDFERRCVTVPKTLYKAIEKNGGVLE